MSNTAGIIPRGGFAALGKQVCEFAIVVSTRLDVLLDKEQTRAEISHDLFCIIAHSLGEIIEIADLKNVPKVLCLQDEHTHLLLYFSYSVHLEMLCPPRDEKAQSSTTPSIRIYGFMPYQAPSSSPSRRHWAPTESHCPNRKLPAKGRPEASLA